MNLSPEQSARYIAISDLALGREDEWTKEYDKKRDGDVYYPYLIKRINEEWKHDNSEVTEKDYDFIINNAYEIYDGKWHAYAIKRRMMGWLKGLTRNLHP